MRVLFSTEVGTYLRDAREREPGSILALVRELERLNAGDETILEKIPHTTFDKDTYFLNVGGFIVTMIKRPNGDFHVTDITKGVLTDEIVRKVG